MSTTCNVGYEDRPERGNGLKIDLGYTHDEGYYNIFEYKYYNLDVFLKALITLPINYEVFTNPASMEDNYGFTKTKSFEEAWNYCRFGYDEGYDVFCEGLNHINFKKSNIEKPINQYKVVGYKPNVSRFLMGNPNNMKNKVVDERKTAITIKIEASYSAYTSTDAINNRGICIINLITYLEKIGYDCILEYESTTVCGNEKIIISVPIKRKDEKLNVKMCYFPLVHPSFLRRLIFRAKEIIPNISIYWESGYGTPYKRTDEEILKLGNTIYISTPSEMGLNGYNLDEDYESFVRYINEKYHLSDKGDDKSCQKTYGKR